MQLQSAFAGKINMLASFYGLAAERMDHKTMQGYREVP